VPGAPWGGPFPENLPLVSPAYSKAFEAPSGPAASRVHVIVLVLVFAPTPFIWGSFFFFFAGS
jgi:hypothetical protein